MSDGAIVSCTALVNLTLPARLKKFEKAEHEIFSLFGKLENINIVGSFDNAAYSSIDGVLFNAAKAHPALLSRRSTTRTAALHAADGGAQHCRKGVLYQPVFNQNQEYGQRGVFTRQRPHDRGGSVCGVRQSDKGCFCRERAPRRHNGLSAEGLSPIVPSLPSWFLKKAGQ